MENTNEVVELKPAIIKRIQTIITKYWNFLSPEDFLLFIDSSEPGFYTDYKAINTLIITKVEDFPKDKNMI